MRVDVTSRREEFFSIPRAAQVLRRKSVEPSTFKSFQEVQDLLNQGRFVSGASNPTAGGTIRGFATAESVVQAANSLRSRQVLVLPASAYVPNTLAGRLRNYTEDAFVNTESVAAGRAYTKKPSFTRWSDELRVEHQATPTKLLAHALAEESRDALRKPLMGYSFGGSVVEWAHVFFGAEMRVWQNKFGFYKGIARQHKRLEELATQKGGLVARKKRRAQDALRFYEECVDRYDLDEEVYQLSSAGHDCLDDLIEVDGKPGLRTEWYGLNKTLQAPTHWRMKVFRRTSPDEKRVISYNHLPVTPPGLQEAAAGFVHKMSYAGDSGHELYANLALKGYPWTAEAVAGAHSVARIVEQAGSVKFYSPHDVGSRWHEEPFSIGQLPFPIPTKEGTRFADTVRYDTVFLGYDEERGRVVSKSANLATLSKLLGAKLLVDGVDSSLAMSKEELYARGEDPMRYAVTVEFDDVNP